MSAPPHAAVTSWDGSTAVHTRTWSVVASVDALILATLPEHMAETHPLIERVDVRHATVHDDGEAIDFVVHERVPVGPWSVPTQYRGRHWQRSDGLKMVIEGWAAAGVYIVHHLELTPAADRVDVAHTVRIRAPWCVRAFVARTALRAHEAWVANIIRRAEAG